jgi:hypothetical protein
MPPCDRDSTTLLCTRHATDITHTHTHTHTIICPGDTQLTSAHTQRTHTQGLPTAKLSSSQVSAHHFLMTLLSQKSHLPSRLPLKKGLKGRLLSQTVSKCQLIFRFLFSILSRCARGRLLFCILCCLYYVYMYMYMYMYVIYIMHACTYVCVCVCVCAHTHTYTGCNGADEANHNVWRCLWCNGPQQPSLLFFLPFFPLGASVIPLFKTPL